VAGCGAAIAGAIARIRIGHDRVDPVIVRARGGAAYVPQALTAALPRLA